jgi:hypothetical protein
VKFVLVVVSSGRTRPYIESEDTVDRRWQELTMQLGFGCRVEMWATEKDGPMTFVQAYE